MLLYLEIQVYIERNFLYAVLEILGKMEQQEEMR